jgi:uncharacterized membrane protein YobD (UPF0266 family)
MYKKFGSLNYLFYLRGMIALTIENTKTFFRELFAKKVLKTKEELIIEKYSLIEYDNPLYEDYSTWFRKDMLFFIEQGFAYGGVWVDNYRILPNTNDVAFMEDIDFSRLEFKDFEEAAKKMNDL